MNKIIAIVLLCVVSLYSAPLHWEKDLHTAFSKAKKENKIVMVLAEADYCRWCKKMKNETLADIEVSKKLEEFILVQIDRDKVKVDYIPYAKYIPTIYFISKDKELIEQVTGYFCVLDFKSWIDDVKKEME